MELEFSQSYANFRAWCPRKEVSVGILHPVPWKYYDWGPKAYPEPVVCLHSLIGSAESFYQQIIALAPRGYRVISIQIPVYWTVAEFCDAFHSFIETIPHRRLHIYGAGLGGFLAMHYAVRKPDHVASLVLTHSFLATDNLNLRIPYSAAVLRWLPDFLVRGTMRAILPKGRVSLDMANAAELAIGQTMICPRDVLASRMALSVTSSTVVKRIHIPESNITLIDTLDRLPPALDLSERTAAELPNARRALLKTGGDFPYLSAPDDVNVHLIVHLRRNAVDPVADIPVPVPARPRKIYVKPRPRVGTDTQSSEGSQANSERASSSDRQKRRSPEEILQAARALVAADERSRIEKYTYEVGRLREFIPDRSDAYLCAVLEHFEWDLDLAISNALQDQFNDDFYEEIVKAAVNEAVEKLQKVEEIREEEEETDQAEASTQEKVGEAQSVDAKKEAGNDDNSIQERTQSGRDGDLGSKRGVISDQDPLGETQFYVKDVASQIDEQHEVASNQHESGKTQLDNNVVRSPDAKTSDSMSTDVDDNDPLANQRTDSKSTSAMSSVDLSAADRYTNLANGETSPITKGGPAAITTSEKMDSTTASRTPRRSRRPSVHSTADGIEAYVSSEKVGMRTRGNLVGRGPAPFNNVIIDSTLGPSEAWTRTPRLKEEEEMNDEDSTPPPVPSGASLLETSINPLDLPSLETEYQERRRARTPSSERRSRRDGMSNSRASTPPFPSWQSRGRTQTMSLLIPEEEALLGTAATIVENASPVGKDDWEVFRRPEKGLAEVIPSAIEEPEKKETDKTVEVGDLEMEGESDDSARLREWRMSAAQAASKNVNR